VADELGILTTDHRRSPIPEHLRSLRRVLQLLGELLHLPAPLSRFLSACISSASGTSELGYSVMSPAVSGDHSVAAISPVVSP
jgi:hypothetical protein